jgi:hypothetical protein
MGGDEELDFSRSGDDDGRPIAFPQLGIGSDAPFDAIGCGRAAVAIVCNCSFVDELERLFGGVSNQCPPQALVWRLACVSKLREGPPPLSSQSRGDRMVGSRASWVDTLTGGLLFKRATCLDFCRASPPLSSAGPAHAQPPPFQLVLPPINAARFRPTTHATSGHGRAGWSLWRLVAVVGHAQHPTDRVRFCAHVVVACGRLLLLQPFQSMHPPAPHATNLTPLPHTRTTTQADQASLLASRRPANQPGPNFVRANQAARRESPAADPAAL